MCLGIMLDLHYVVNDTDALIAQLKRRGVDATVAADLSRMAETRRAAIRHVESLRQAMNTASGEVQKLAQKGDQSGVEKARGALKDLKAEIKAGEEAQISAEAALDELLLMVPNIPQNTVPDGPDASGNRVERQIGKPRAMDFKPQSHWDLVEKLGIVSFDQAAKISGARFALYRGLGARLERAIATFMLDIARENGYMEIAPPLMVRRESMQASGQFPKFEGESFETLDREYALIPTSEVPLVNMHRDEIFDAATLPLRYTAFTPCFRREAGSAGKDTRGLIRLHQFNKVELVSYTAPEDSVAELERLVGNAEEVLKRLELPYQVMTLCTGDMGFAAAKTYDIEVWLPGQQAYREISSCSNCEDFQARRGRIRYRPSEADSKKAKPRLVHTLNGSALATGRAFVAVVENYQQADGTIRVPGVLVPYVGTDVIAGP